MPVYPSYLGWITCSTLSLLNFDWWEMSLIKTFFFLLFWPAWRCRCCEDVRLCYSDHFASSKQIIKMKGWQQQAWSDCFRSHFNGRLKVNVKNTICSMPMWKKHTHFTSLYFNKPYSTNKINLQVNMNIYSTCLKSIKTHEYLLTAGISPEFPIVCMKKFTLEKSQFTLHTNVWEEAFTGICFISSFAFQIQVFG